MERQPQSGGGFISGFPPVAFNSHRDWREYQSNTRPKLGPGWQSLGQSSGTHWLRACLNELGEVRCTTHVLFRCALEKAVLDSTSVCFVYSLCDFSLVAVAATFSSQMLLLAPTFVRSGSAH